MKVEGLGKPKGCKLLRISAELENDALMSIQIRGDFFASPEEVFDQIEEALAGIRLRDLSRVFDSLIREKGVEICGINGPGLAEVLISATNAGPEYPKEARHGP
jgi:hypothetical protein